MIITLILWFALAIVIGVAADSRGRNGGGWFFLALLISPLIAGIMLFVLPAHTSWNVLRTLRQCPACAELVKREAKVCKHCGSALPPLVIEVESQEARAARLKVQDRQAIFGSVIAIIAIIGLFVSFAVAARAEEQTRFYGPNGQSLGTAAPQGNGTTRYYDARGNSLGTSTTTGRSTTFYGPRGNVTGHAYR